LGLKREVLAKINGMDLEEKLKKTRVFSKALLENCKKKLG
jgi:hypothetical protein